MADVNAGVSAGVDTGHAQTGNSMTVAPSSANDVGAVDLNFATSSAALQANAHDELLAAATWAKCTPKGALILEGHADRRGTADYNLKLSAERAASVRQKLIAMGVPSDRIVITVYGKFGPRRGTLAEDRRVTVRAGERPIRPEDITAQK
jgi:outer membrane protein OmpA-like peptidoglycan-associated protein